MICQCLVDNLVFAMAPGQQASRVINILQNNYFLNYVTSENLDRLNTMVIDEYGLYLAELSHFIKNSFFRNIEWRWTYISICVCIVYKEKNAFTQKALVGTWWTHVIIIDSPVKSSLLLSV